MAKLEIVVAIHEGKGIMLGRTVFLFNKPRVAVGMWNNDSIVFATDNPKNLSEVNVLIYTKEELKELYLDGNIQGLVEAER